MTKREICERLLILYADVNSIQTQIGLWNEPLDDAERDIRKAILDLVEPEEEKQEGEPKSKFPIGHPLHMSTEEMKAADTALFTQTGGRMGKDWRNAEEKKEPPVRICNGKFAYTDCYCGGKAYVKMRIHEGEAFVAKCAKCGNVLQGVSDWRIDWTNDPPPENLFAEEKPKAKEPPLLIYEERGEKVPCPVCGEPAAPIKNKPGVFLCKRCGGLVCAEEGSK